MSNTLHWGILGAGNIAKTFARGVAHSRHGRVVAIGSREQAKAEKFGDELNIPKRHGSYDALLADKEVQAVYIATPHPTHAYWAIQAAEAGKHILCEKPLALNHAEAMAMVEAARANDVFLMEAFMYRCHPLTFKLVELIQQKVIGEVRVIQATFSFQAGFFPNGRLWANNMGGGGILDVGCYPVSLARLVAGAAIGKDFAEPIDVKGIAKLNGVTGVDEYALADLKFAGGIVANLATGIAVNQDNSVRIFGSEGNIHVPQMWIPGREGQAVSLTVTRNGKEPQEIKVQTDQWLYGIEADVVAQNLERRQAPSPAMSWDDSLGNMRVLDQWRQSIGLTYESEKPQNVQPIHGKAPARAANHRMRYDKIGGVALPVSRLVMGVDNFSSAPHVAVMFDEYFTLGGNCFDSAYIYGGGVCERALGGWIKARGLRSQVVILDKGAHTPFCDPISITRQHKESLDRLQTDYVDIYMLHRDNLNYPVDELMGVLNEHVSAGTMKAIGVSNWSIDRIEAANQWAKINGKVGISAVSNNFSLARMVKPVWAGCISASDADSRAWFKRTQMPLMPWSSQARGFFVPGRAAPEIKDDAELVNAWYSDDNFQRQARAFELAKKKNVHPINIALAYVLNQPFPTFALIGPRTLSELHTSLPGLDVELTAAEVGWLNLED